MKILSIRQPFASALLTGVYDAERRKFRLSGPTLIHAALADGIPFGQCADWLRSRDPIAAQAFGACQDRDDAPEYPEEETPLARVIGEAGDVFGAFFPIGVVVGYVANWEPIREGLGWANRPVGAIHFPISTALPQHVGSLGSLPAPAKIIDLVMAWIPQA